MSAIKDRSKALENALAALKEEGADASSLAVIEGEIKALRSAYDEKVKEMERFQIMFEVIETIEVTEHISFTRISCAAFADLNSRWLNKRF